MRAECCGVGARVGGESGERLRAMWRPLNVLVERLQDVHSRMENP